MLGRVHPGESIEVDTTDCKTLESRVDGDWVGLGGDPNATRGTARLGVIWKNEPGALAAVANIFGANKANILNLQLSNREGPFHTDIIDIEEHDTAHIMRILSALRSIEPVIQADRV